MTGHRKRLYLALPRWAHEVYSTNRGIVGWAYSDRRRRRAKTLAHKLLRTYQKKQDRMDIKEQTEG